MNPHIRFNIKGIKGISISGDEHIFSIKNDEGNIESVEMLLKDVDIIGVQVNFSDDTIINTTIVDYAHKKVELFVAKMICELDATVDGLEITTGTIHNPNLTVNEGPTRILSTMGMACSSSATTSYALDRYKGLFQNLPASADKEDKYIVLSNIMKINNIAVRYLMQYEFLKYLVSHSNKQKEVTSFIKDQYNPTLSFNQIGFHKTRKPEKDYDEDDITYYRNILAHNDFSALPQNYEDIIVTMSRAIVRVINYAIRQMN